MKEPIDLDDEVVRYSGPVKPDMPMELSWNQKPSDDLDKAVVSLYRARELDYSFLSNVLQEADTPEYNGFNTQVCRESGMQTACKSIVRYMPLLNMKPADPDTVNTVIVKGLSIIEGANQDYFVMTADMQIYKIIVSIIFATLDLRTKVIPILGSTHFLMDFVSCVGTLMSGSGLKSILCGTFGSVEKRLEGKKYPHNIRALRLLTEEILRPIITKMSWTTWLAWRILRQNFLLKVELQRSDYALLTATINKMLPHFFATHKHNYARYGLFLCPSLTYLPIHVEQQFLHGEHILHHSDGVWNGIPSDQFIETTWMKCGKGPSGVIGATQNTQNSGDVSP